jgi:hypothetical protein
MKTEEILNEREKTHGDFDRVAYVYESLKNIIELHINSYNATQRLAIFMILLKLARIICGDANYDDHWDDIAGYALLGKGKEECVCNVCEDEKPAGLVEEDGLLVYMCNACFKSNRNA